MQKNLGFFNIFLRWMKKKEIDKVMHYIIEFSLLFIENSAQINFPEKFYITLEYNKIGNEIKDCLKNISCNFNNLK